MEDADNNIKYIASNSNYIPQEEGNNYIPQGEETNVPDNRKRTRLIVCAVVAVLGLAAAVGGVCGSGHCSSGSGSASTATEPTPGEPTPAVPTLAPAAPSDLPTLQTVAQRGALRCGVTEQTGFSQMNTETGEREGFDVDLCKAVAAAVFGDAEGKVEYVILEFANVFTSLRDDQVDLVAAGVTHNMERDVFEASTKTGFSFSIPYLYNGMGFGGLPEYVECTENIDETNQQRKLQTTEAPAPVAASLAPSPSPTSICKNFQICVIAGSTHIGRVQELLPDARIVQAISNAALYDNFIKEYCQVIAGEQFEISEGAVRNNGYFGEYKVGSSLYSREPLAMVTRDGDATWSDFVNWVLQGLLAAEEQGVTKDTANVFTKSSVFDQEFQNMFVDAVAEVGNYAEIYERNLESMIPRALVNTINAGDLGGGGDTGLIYSHPFGSLEANQEFGPGPVEGGTLETIVQRGHLRCGITTRLLAAEFNATTGERRGFDVDYCKAVSAAIFAGDTKSIVYIELPANQRFQALASGSVDLLARITTNNLVRDVMEPNAGEGLSFTQVYFYDSLTFGGVPPYGDCAENLDITSTQCEDLRICALQGTTIINSLRELYPERVIVPRQDGVLNIQGISEGVCNAVAGGLMDVAPRSLREIGNYNGPYQVGSKRFSKDPFGLVTRQNDPQWTAFVYWIVSGIFYAEEQGITQATSYRMPVINLFGPLYAKFLRYVIGAVGSFGEIYNRNIEQEIPRAGLHLLNDNPLGPQHFPLPGL